MPNLSGAAVQHSFCPVLRLFVNRQCSHYLLHRRVSGVSVGGKPMRRQVSGEAFAIRFFEFGRRFCTPLPPLQTVKPCDRCR
mmetsp:Transcript_36622/g.84438  ORF Transcript_36622/g.84438 Transcript_36622/m.84438 type:complete len:82 (-) Transcript_36622:104-349(-)